MTMTIDEARDMLEEKFELDPILEDHLFNSDVIMSIFNEFPELVATSITGAGYYPLHDILQHQPTLELVKITHQAYPIAINERGVLGYTPLHYACHFRCSSDVVCYLAEACPQALDMSDSAFGSTPLEVLLKDPTCSVETLKFLVTSFPGNVWKRCEDTNNEEIVKVSKKKEDDDDSDDDNDDDDDKEYQQYIDEDHLRYFNPIETLIKHNQSSKKVKALLDAYPNEKLTLSCCRPNHEAMTPSDDDGEYGSDFDDGASQKQNQEFLGIDSSVADAIGSSCGKTNGVRILDCQACSFTAAGYKALFEGIAKEAEPAAEQPSFRMGLEELHINLGESDIQLDPKGVAKALENMVATNTSIRLLSIVINPGKSANKIRSVPHQQNSDTSKIMRRAQCNDDAQAQQQTQESLFDLILGQALARGLSKNQCIRELHIKSPFFSLDVQNLGRENLQKIIQDSKSIESFHFGGIRGSAVPLALGLRDRQHQAQTQPTRGIRPLSSLSISNCQLTSHHAQEMVKTLSSDFFRHHLKKLHIRDDVGNGGHKKDPSMRPEALHGVANLTGLEELSISIPTIEEYRLACMLKDRSGCWKEEVDSMESALRADWLNEVVIPCLEGGSKDGDCSNLKHFTLNGIQWKEQQEIDIVAQALQTCKLRSVRLELDHNNEDDGTRCQIDFSSLVDALREHNCHLEDMGSFLLPRNVGNSDDDNNDDDYGFVSPPHYHCVEIEESQKKDMRYYCKLNAAGRRVIHEEKVRKDDFVGILSGVSNDTGLSYGLLHHLPQLWMR